MNADQLEQILENVVRRVYRRELDGLRAQVELIHQRLDKIAPRKMAAAVAGAESLGDLEGRVRLNALDEIRSVYILWTDGGANKRTVGDAEAARRIGAALRHAGLSAPLTAKERATDHGDPAVAPSDV